MISASFISHSFLLHLSMLQSFWTKSVSTIFVDALGVMHSLCILLAIPWLLNSLQYLFGVLILTKIRQVNSICELTMPDFDQFQKMLQGWIKLSHSLVTVIFNQLFKLRTGAVHTLQRLRNIFFPV